jgi:fucose permease
MRGALPLALCFAGFASLGLPDGVLGVAWPSLRAGFGLPVDALGVLLVASTAGYVVSSFASGFLVARLRLGPLLALSCLATAASFAGYATAPSWPLLVPWGAVAGLGAGAIDAAINGYAAQHHGARTVSLMHAAYGVGTTAGPLLMTQVLMAGLSWRRGYALVAAAQLGLALCFAATHSAWPRMAASAEVRAVRAPRVRETLRKPAVWLAVTAFCVYTGIEAAAGAWTYSLLHEARGVPMGPAGAAASAFWAGLLGGRLALGLSPWQLEPARLLRACALGVVTGATALAAGSSGPAAFAGIALLGLACAPIFPALIASTPARIGHEHAAHAVGFQIAAAGIGQSGIPALLGVLAAARGLEASAQALVALALALVVTLELLERVSARGLAQPVAARRHPSRV